MSSDALCSDRLNVALDLAEVAEEMLAQRLRREHPEPSEDDIHQRLRAWYENRPGARFGDAEGRPDQWPRRR